VWQNCLLFSAWWLKVDCQRFSAIFFASFSGNRGREFPGVRSHVVIEFASSSIKWRKLLASGIELGPPHVHFSYVYRTVAMYFPFFSSVRFRLTTSFGWGKAQKVKRKERKTKISLGCQSQGSHMCGYQ